MNAEEFAAIKKQTDEQMAAFDKESQKLCDDLARAQEGLADLATRRQRAKETLRMATVSFQMSRMGIAQPNVVNVPPAKIAVKGN